MAQYLSEEDQIDDSNAAWATQFQGSSTNLSQRMRYADDIKKGNENQQARDTVANDRYLAGNKGMRDLVFGRQREKRADEQFQFQKEKQVFLEQRKIKEDAIKMEHEKAAMARDTWKRDNEERELKDTLKFQSEVQDMLSNGLVEGSPGYAAGLMQAIRNSPFADKAQKDIAIKGARIKGDPHAMQEYAEANGLEMSGMRVNPENGDLEPIFARKRVGPNASGSAGPNGKPKANPNEKEIQSTEREIARLNPKSKSDAAKIQRLTEYANGLKPKAGMGDVKASSNEASAPAPSVATAPSNPSSKPSKPKTVKQNGVTYTLGDDGEYH